MRFRVSLALAAVIGLAAAAPDALLVEKLRHGGYVLYVRHATTDFGRNDSRMTSFEDCSTQRNLTDKGRTESRQLGAEIKRLRILCRTMETARLATSRSRSCSPPAGTTSSRAPWSISPRSRSSAGSGSTIGRASIRASG